jgi:TPR repeat protein
MRIITLLILLLLGTIAPAVAGPFDDGLAAYKDGDWAKAFEILKPLAELDNSQSAVAQLRLAHLYERGLGTPKDLAAAAKWFRKSAEQGNVTAEAHLGRLYRLGAGVPKDGAQAARWSMKAASQGNAIGQSNLGYMALDGDPAGAASWFKKAADQGDTSAMMGLASLYEQGRGVAKDPVQARKWYALASVDDAEYGAELAGRAKKAEDALAAKMSPTQIAQADKLIADFKEAAKR